MAPLEAQKETLPGVEKDSASPNAEAAASPANQAATQARHLRPAKGWQAVDFRELWRFRELFLIFALRDIKVRYKQTIIGGLWALIQPIAFAVVGVLVFSKAAGVGTDGVEPAFLFYLVSQLPWMLFNSGFQASSMSLVSAQNMLKKVYFPRLILPISSVMVSLIDFLIQLGLVALILLALPFLPGTDAFVPPPQVVLVPLAALWAFVAAMSLGVPLAALNVEFRDVRYVLPFMTQFVIFAAPVFWPASQLPDAWRPVYGLLPIAGPIEFFRWCLLDTPAYPAMWAVGLLSTAVCLVAGVAYFARMEGRFADVV